MKIKNKLYNGQVILEFNTFKHTYSVKGEDIPSVTKILNIINKPALVNWSANMAVNHMEEKLEPGKPYDELELDDMFNGARQAHWQTRDKAGSTGTKIHNWIEAYVNNENPGMPINEQLHDAINNFLAWEKEHKVKFLLSEQPVYSRKFKYAGIMDLICEIDGELYVVDIKTSKAIYPGYWLQTSAYRYARTEEYPDEKYVGQIIIRVGKDGTFNLEYMRDTKLYQEMFMAFLYAQKLQKTHKFLETYKGEKE